jgi:hypothetical protein
MFIDNLLVRVHLIIEMSRPALLHGSLNSNFQVALYLSFEFTIPNWREGMHTLLENTNRRRGKGRCTVLKWFTALITRE